MQGNSRVIKSPTEPKIQPTIHLEGKYGYLTTSLSRFTLQMYCGLHCQFRGLIITRASPCIPGD
jgi:hypothetical protein